MACDDLRPEPASGRSSVGPHGGRATSHPPLWLGCSTARHSPALQCSFGTARNLIRPHEITLTDRKAVVSQERIARGDMKEKLRQAVAGQIALTSQLLLFRRTGPEHDFLCFTVFELRRIQAVQKFKCLRE